MAGGISIGLVQGANSANPTRDAFDARAGQLTQQRTADMQIERQKVSDQRETERFGMEKQKFANEEIARKDADMLKVFEFAGAGYVDEARYLAQQKGLQVPDEIYSNADFAQGLSMAGKIYGDDKVAAQKFTQAWLATPPGTDTQARLSAAQQAAGLATNPEDRTLQRQISLEKWKINNRVGDGTDRSFTLTPGQVRYDASGQPIASVPPDASDAKTKYVQDIVSSAMNSSMGQQIDMNKIANEAAAQYDQLFGSTAATAGGGVTTPMVSPQQPAAAPASKGVYAVQQLQLQGYNAAQIKDGLIQRGATPEQAQGLLDAAGIK